MTLLHKPDLLPDVAEAKTVQSVGSSSELIACAELMRIGFYVYRCESPAAPFDLVAYRSGECLRVEVKTITFREGNAPLFTPPRNDEWDLLVVVGREADAFVFDRSTSTLDARNVIRRHYGYGPVPGLLDIPCGTTRGYHAHLRRKEDMCEPCREAMREHGKRHRRAKELA